jgi:hypothetical protein
MLKLDRTLDRFSNLLVDYGFVPRTIDASEEYVLTGQAQLAPYLFDVSTL